MFKNFWEFIIYLTRLTMINLGPLKTHGRCGIDYRYNDTEHQGICDKGLECFCSVRCPGICIPQYETGRYGTYVVLTTFLLDPKLQ